jgi:hypothetical protein
VNWYEPSLSVAISRDSFVLVLVSVTFALGTTAPVESDTVPEMFAVTSAARADEASNKSASDKARAEITSIRWVATRFRVMKKSSPGLSNGHNFFCKVKTTQQNVKSCEELCLLISAIIRPELKAFNTSITRGVHFLYTDFSIAKYYTL